LEFGRHERKRKRLLAAFGTGDRLSGLGARERSERGIDDPAEVDALGQASRDVVGDVEPASPRKPVARVIATTHSLGVLSLSRGAAQASSDVINALATSLRSPSVSRKVLASRSTSAGGGTSAMKWRTSFVATCVAVAG
jgi:hypothetical protein